MARPRGQSLGGRYRAQPVDPVTGRRMNVSAGTVSELESRLERIGHVRDGLKFGDISVREAKGRLRPAVGLSLAFRPIVESYLRGIPDASLPSYENAWRKMVEPWFGEVSVWDLEESALRAWQTELARIRRPRGKRGYAPKSIRFAWDLIKGAVNLALRDGRLSEVPWGTFSVPNPKRPQKPRESLRDPGELLRLLVAARAYDEAHRRHHDSIFAPLCFLVLTGLRQAEGAGLSWDDVDLDRNPPELHIRKQARRGWQRRDGGSRPTRRPKGGEVRTQVLHVDAVRVLKMQAHKLRQEGRFAPDGPVFPRQGSAKFRTSGSVVRPDALRKVAQMAGLPSVDHWTTHSLRHSYSRLELIGHGGDLRTVADHRTGHRDLEALGDYMRQPSREIGGSKIPELPPALLPSLEMRAEPMIQEGEMLALEPFTGIALEAAATWTDHARAWVEAGRPRRRPKEVTAEIKAIYSRAYKRALRESGDRGIAARAGERAKNGALGAWAKAIGGVQS